MSMSVTVTHSIGDLAADLRQIARQAPRDMRETVRQGLITGNTVARDNARRTSGTHGKHYPRSFTWEMYGSYGFGGVGSYSGEYGPDSARLQGAMGEGFENGSRNQPPHGDLAKSADLIGPSFGAEVGRLPGKWFWM